MTRKVTMAIRRIRVANAITMSVDVTSGGKDDFQASPIIKAVSKTAATAKNRSGLATVFTILCSAALVSFIGSIEGVDEFPK